MYFSDMFEYKCVEDIGETFQCLSIKQRNDKAGSPIKVTPKDGYIDLSPCIGNFVEATFFDNYNFYDSLSYCRYYDQFKWWLNGIDTNNLQVQMRVLTAFSTGHRRYITQVTKPFITNAQAERITKRLATEFNENEICQLHTKILFKTPESDTELFEAVGAADVVKDDTVFELKFVSELRYEHFLQCAMYMIGLNIEKGILWNIRNNDMYEITIPDKQKFMDCVFKTITKGKYEKFDMTVLNII